MSFESVQVLVRRGTRVRKISGSEWEGVVVGYYETDLTPDGVCVESATHKGSVQIYPLKALEILS
jgi:dihydrofolate reductase (trimethoprim resistance protein)